MLVVGKGGLPPLLRSRETKGAELTSQKKASGKSGSVGFYRASLLTACYFGPLAHHFDASDFFFTPSFRLAVETLSVHVCVEFKSWPAPIELSSADESIVEGCRSHRLQIVSSPALISPRTRNRRSPSFSLIHASGNSAVCPLCLYICFASSVCILAAWLSTSDSCSERITERPCLIFFGQHCSLKGQAWQSPALARYLYLHLLRRRSFPL